MRTPLDKLQYKYNTLRIISLVLIFGLFWAIACCVALVDQRNIWRETAWKNSDVCVKIIQQNRTLAP